MATAAVDPDDEISLLYETPATRKKGTTKLDAISVEDYHIHFKPKLVNNTFKSFNSKFIVDLSKNTPEDDDVTVISCTSKGRNFYIGECSNSKSEDTDSGVEIIDRIPLKTVCEICTDEKLRTDMFRILGCSHYYCCSCIEQYVASKLQDNIIQINCPVPECNGKLEPYHCRRILPEKVFERWGDVLCESLILGSEKFYCPFKDCSAMLVDDNGGGGEGGIVESECPFCNRLFCARCQVPWHAGIECAEFQKLKKDERGSDDIMLMNLAKSNSLQRCPKCNFYVERIDGCLIMLCRCKHSFCYRCAAPLTKHECDKCGVWDRRR